MLAAILVSLAVVLTRFFSVTLSVFRIGIGMVPVHLAGFLLGPFYGALTGLTADFLGIMINPMGPPNLGIMLTTTLQGLLAGLVMVTFKRKLTPGVVVVSGMVTMLVCSLFMMSYFLDQIYGKGFTILLQTRAPGVLVQGFVLMVIESLLIPLFASMKAFLPTDTAISWRRGRAGENYDKISEYSYKTRR